MKLSLRIIISVSLFLIFVVLSVAAALTHSFDSQAPYIFGLLIIAMLILPRQLQRPEGATKEQIEHLIRVQKWLLFTRLGYFLTAVFVFAGLPKLVG